MNALTKLVVFFNSISKLALSISIAIFDVIIIFNSIKLILQMSGEVNSLNLITIFSIFTVVNLVGHYYIEGGN